MMDFLRDEYGRRGLSEDEELFSAIRREAEYLAGRIETLADDAYTGSCSEERLRELYSLTGRGSFKGSEERMREYLCGRKKLRLSPLASDTDRLFEAASAVGDILEDEGAVLIYEGRDIGRAAAAEEMRKLLPLHMKFEIVTEGDCWGFLDAKNLTWEEIDGGN